MALNVNELSLIGLTADPITPPNGCAWYRSDLNEFRIQRNGVAETVSMVSDGAVSLIHDEVTAENQVTMSGSTWLDMPDMSITPIAGIYYCIFNCSLHSTGSNGLAKFRLNHNGGKAVTERQHEGTDWASETTICIITADGINPIKVEYSHGGNGNNEVRDRIFSIIKIG